MSTNLHSIMEAFRGLNVLVIGEAMLDRYLKGSSNRLSQEAPVLVVGVEDREDAPGGAANTAANVRSLGATPYFLSVIGDDEEGRCLRSALTALDISPEWLISQPGRQTLSKQRILVNNQMMLRFDQGSTEPISAEDEDRLIAALETLVPRMDAIIISDYGYGILTPRILQALGALQARELRVLAVDSRSLKSYRGLHVTAVKPNYNETIQLLHLDKAENNEARLQQVLEHGHKILDLVESQIAVVTLDKDGALFFERDQPVYRVYARPAPANRVAGAGDTFMSAFALSLAAGAQTGTSAELASAAAAIVVEKPGTSTCFLDELRGYFSSGEKYITDQFEVTALAAALHHQKKVVFTNGCFDILHSGHIHYLNQAKSYGDVLIVGINSDPGVTRLKGPNRPINPLEERVGVLAGMSGVDYIIPFDEDVPFSLIRLIKPDVYVKGGDYTLDQLPEAELIEEQGGRVILLPYTSNYSTNGIIERIRQVYVTPHSE